MNKVKNSKKKNHQFLKINAFFSHPHLKCNLTETNIKSY